MKHFSFLLLFLLCSLAKAQTPDSAKAIGIHPAVGKSISCGEKIKYRLFTEYKDSLFKSAEVLKFNDSTYEAVIHTTKGIDVKTYLSTEEMDRLYFRIDEISKADKQHAGNFTDPSEEEEEKRIKRKQRASAAGDIFLEILGQAIIVSLQVMLTAVLTN